MTDSKFVTVFSGDLAEVLGMRSELEAEGLHPLAADEHTKSIDPFITGGYVFAVQLQVPESEAGTANEIIQSRQARARQNRDKIEKTPIDLANLNGRRLRWATILMTVLPPLPLPFTLLLIVYLRFALAYVLQVRKLEQKPIAHRLTMTCLVIVVVIYSALSVFMYFNF